MVANSLIAIDMPFEIDPSHIDQYNKMYLSRLEKLSHRINLPQKVHKVQEVEARLGLICVVGIIKRI